MGQIQDHAISEHGHKTSGHTHFDSGHTHADKGHNHNLTSNKFMEILAPGNWLGDGNGHMNWAKSRVYPPINNDGLSLSKANIQIGRAQISRGYSVISGVVNGRITTETRPRNAKYPYIMKVTNVNCKVTNEHGSVIVGWLPRDQKIDSNLWIISVELNKRKVFLRGSLETSSGVFEMDSMQEHSHKDLGHSHLDLGHTHEDNGHFHRILERYKVLRPGST